MEGEARYLETAPVGGGCHRGAPRLPPTPHSLLLVGFWPQLAVCQGHLGFLLQDTGTAYPKAGLS